MTLKIAIQPDEAIYHDGERQSFSQRWIDLAQSWDIEAVPVDVFSRDVMDRISDCDAFMWRHNPSAHPRLYAKRLLYAVEKGLGIPVYPSLQSAWHYEDKISQYYFLSATGIPTPSTDIFWTRSQAERFCEAAAYPFVLKLAAGYRSSNVRLVQTRDAALFYVNQLFGPGIRNLGYRPAPRPRLMLRRLRAAAAAAQGRNPHGPTPGAELEYGYFYAQEFLPGNAFDFRVIIIGNRAVALRRFNRPGDFRASGGGYEDWDPEQIGEDVLRLAYRLAWQLDTQAIAADVLRRGSQPVIGELSLGFPTKGVGNCPGHWVLDGEPESGRLTWVPGPVRLEDAIFEDFVTEVRRSKGIHITNNK